MISSEGRLGYASVVMAMSLDFWMGKITWEHYVTTLRFTAQQMYDKSGPLEDPYLPPPAPEPAPADPEEGARPTKEKKGEKA